MVRNSVFVIENTGRGERMYDIYSRLLKDRIVLLGTPIDDHVANSICAQLLFWSPRTPRSRSTCTSTLPAVP